MKTIAIVYSSEKYGWGTFDEKIDSIMDSFNAIALGGGTCLKSGSRDICFEVESDQLEEVNKALKEEFKEKIDIHSY